MFRAPRVVRYLVQLVGVLLMVYLLRRYTKGTDLEGNWMLRHLGNQENNIKKIGTRIRISCWIMTSPSNLETRAIYIQRTWASRCDRVVFISSETNTTFPTVGVKAKEGRRYLTQKTLRGFNYVAKNHLDDCDWFFKADDDTYVIMENLRHFLEDKDPNEPIYYGYHFKKTYEFITQGFSSGGSGMVVSKEAMRRFKKGGLKKKTCRQRGLAGDAAFGQCMEKLGVKLGDSLDSEGRSRFHCFKPVEHLIGLFPNWFFQYDAHGAKKNFLSDLPISFHYVPGGLQLELEYFLYHARVYSHEGFKHN